MGCDHYSIFVLLGLNIKAIIIYTQLYIYELNSLSPVTKI